MARRKPPHRCLGFGPFANPGIVDVKAIAGAAGKITAIAM
jgi:hypothetical protein